GLRYDRRHRDQCYQLRRRPIQEPGDEQRDDDVDEQGYAHVRLSQAARYLKAIPIAKFLTSPSGVGMSLTLSAKSRRFLVLYFRGSAWWARRRSSFSCPSLM